MPPTPLPPGLISLTGPEGCGKTSYLRRIAGDLPLQDGQAQHDDAVYMPPSLPDRDNETPTQVWRAIQARSPHWDPGLQQALAEALDLSAHQNKTLSMLSTGSRRKVALVAVLASGAAVTCLDQPFAALDARSAGVLRDFLNDMADHPSRTWLIADYEADPRLRWRSHIRLDARPETST